MAEPGVQGDLLNLDGGLRDLLTHYQPGSQGVHGVADKLVVTLPVPMWADFGWIESGVGPSVPAAGATAFVVYTVPLDERVVIHAVQASRATGDNELDTIEVRFAEAYKSSANQYLRLIDLASQNDIWWPDPAGTQGGIRRMIPSAMTLEPGTQLLLRPASVGVAASTFNYVLSLVRCRLVRALAPEL